MSAEKSQCWTTPVHSKGRSDRDLTPDDEHCVSVNLHTEASGADGVALRGSAVRHHVSDPSDGDMDQAEPLSSRGIIPARIMITNSNTMLAMRRYPPYHSLTGGA